MRWLRNWANGIYEEEVIITSSSLSRSHNLLLIIYKLSIDKPSHLNEQQAEQADFSELSELMEMSIDEDMYFATNLDEHKMSMHFWVSILEKKLSKIVAKDFFSKMYSTQNCINLERNFINFCNFLLIFSLERRKFY